jgi:hypothetical protein
MQGSPGVFGIIIVLVIVGAVLGLGLRIARASGKLRSPAATWVVVAVVAIIAILLWVVPGALMF